MNYYDNYGFLGANGFPVSGDSLVVKDTQPLTGSYGSESSCTAMGLLTGTINAVLDNSSADKALWKVNYYDDRARVIQQRSNSHLYNRYETASTCYDFIGNVTKNTLWHDNGQSRSTEVYNYTFDKWQRPLTTTHSKDGALDKTLIEGGYIDSLNRYHFLLKDHLGNVRADALADGTIIARYENQATDGFIRLGDSEIDIILFDYGTIENQRTIAINSKESYDVYQVRGDENAKSLFEFFTSNKKVEFSLAQMGREGDGELNFITTSHDIGKEQGMSELINGQLKNDYTFRKLIHNHPRGKASPSTPTNSSAGEQGDDLSNAKSITKIWQSQGKKAPQYYIYDASTKSYVRYDEKGLVK